MFFFNAFLPVVVGCIRVAREPTDVIPSVPQTFSNNSRNLSDEVILQQVVQRLVNDVNQGQYFHRGATLQGRRPDVVHGRRHCTSICSNALLLHQLHALRPPVANHHLCNTNYSHLILSGRLYTA